MNVEILKLSVYERFLINIWEGRGSDAQPMLSQPIDGRRRVKQLKSHCI